MGIDIINNPWGDPGMGTPFLTVEKAPLWGDIRHYFIHVVKLDPTTVDARSTNTGELLAGLVLGRVTATGLYKHSLVGATDGSQVPIAVTVQALAMFNYSSGVAESKHCKTVIKGQIIPSRLGWIDSSTFRTAMRTKFEFNDEY